MSHQDSPWPFDDHNKEPRQDFPPETARTPIKELLTQRQRKRTACLVITVLGLLVITTVVLSLLASYCNPSITSVKGTGRTIPATATSSSADVISNIRNALEPWEIVSNASTVHPRVVLLSPNGSVEASAVKLTYDDTWQKAVAPDIDTVAYTDTALFVTTTGRV